MDPQHCIKSGVAEYACHLSTSEVETGGSEVPGHLQINRTFKAILGYMRLVLKTKTKCEKMKLKKRMNQIPK